MKDRIEQQNNARPAASRHAIERALHRFGVLLNESRVAEIVDLIEGGAAIYYRNDDSKYGVHIVDFAGEACGVVFNPSKRRIVTVMRVKPVSRGRC